MSPIIRKKALPTYLCSIEKQLAKLGTTLEECKRISKHPNETLAFKRGDKTVVLRIPNETVLGSVEHGNILIVHDKDNQHLALVEHSYDQILNKFLIQKTDIHTESVSAGFIMQSLEVLFPLRTFTNINWRTTSTSLSLVA